MEYHQQQDFHYLIQHQSSIILVRIKKPSLVQSCDFLDLRNLDRDPKGRICCWIQCLLFQTQLFTGKCLQREQNAKELALRSGLSGASWYLIVLLSGSTKPQHLPALTFLDWKPLAHWASWWLRPYRI